MDENSVAKTKHIETPVGVTGLQRYGGWVYEEFLPELRWPRAGRIYQEMSDNDPVIGSVLYVAEMLIRGTSWTVKAVSDKAEDKEAADFLQSCIGDMETSWANLICEIVSMFKYGFSFHEIVYKIRRGPMETNRKYKSKYDDGRVGWRRMPIRAQNSLHEWLFDEETGDASTFVQLAPPDYQIHKIPMERGLLFRTRSDKGNPEGRSLLRNAYRPWFFKKHFEEIEGIGIERDLAGFPVLTAPENMDLWNPEDERMVALKSKAEQLVASVRRDAQEGMLLPFGWELELLSSSSSRQINIGETIDRYDNRIAITMLSDIILMGNNRTGSFALADTKQSLLAAALQAQLANIADVFNADAVPKLFAINDFPKIKEYPQLLPGQIQNPSLKELALILRSMNMPITKDLELMNFLRHITGMPELSKKDFEEIYVKPEEEAAAALATKQPKADGKTAQQRANDKRDPDDTAQNDLETANVDGGK